MSAWVGGCWPARAQRLLLRAALLPDGRGAEAWKLWRERVDLAAIDVGSREILPLLHANVRRLGLPDPDVRRFATARQTTWLRNQRLFRAGQSVLRDLATEGIDAIALKGLALAHCCYPDPGLRPMGDVDLLVRRRDFERAGGLLRRRGWSLRTEAGHARSFVDSASREIDLHHYALLDCPEAGADAGFWERRRVVDRPGGAIPMLDAADQLLHAVIHGIEWTWRSTPSLLWVADAYLLTTRPDGELNWDGLLEETERRGLTCPLRHALDFLVASLEAPVPEHVLARLAGARVGWGDRLYCLCKRSGVRGMLGSVPATWVEHRRERRGRGQPTSFLAYLRLFGLRFGISRPRDVPRVIGAKLFRRTRSVLGGGADTSPEPVGGGSGAPFDLLASALPTAQHGDLLRACLCPGDEASAAWSRWRGRHEPDRWFARNAGAKRLGSLLAGSLLGSSARLGSFDSAWLEAARSRERSRTRGLRAALREVARSLNRASVSFLVFRGMAAAQMAWVDPALRHCHDIDLLVHEDDLAVAVDVLERTGLRVACHQPAASPEVTLLHPLDVPVVLHGRPLGPPLPHPSFGELDSRAVDLVVDDVQMRAPAADDLLLLVCGDAMTSLSRASGLWVCDAHMIVSRRPELDWSRLRATAASAGLTTGLAVALRYLSRTIGTSVPGAALEALERDAVRAGRFERDVLVHSARVDGTLLRSIWDRAGLRSRISLLQWALVPHRRYLAWVSDGRSGSTVGLWSRRVGRAVRRLKGDRGAWPSPGHLPAGVFEAGSAAADRSEEVPRATADIDCTASRGPASPQ